MNDNHTSDLIMSAIQGNNSAIQEAATRLGCDINAIASAIQGVRSDIASVGSQLGFSSERIINAVNQGDCNVIQALKDCCCETQKSILTSNYENYNICILGTTGTIKSKVYHEHFLSNDIKYIYLNNYDQDIIMNVINDTKADKNRENIKNNLLSVVKNVQNNNDNVLFVLACTELSLYLNDVKKIALVIDAMDCLVNSAILKCGYKLK